MNKEGYERIASDDDCEYEYEIENEFSQRVSSWANHESEPLLHEPEASKDWIFYINSHAIGMVTRVVNLRLDKLGRAVPARKFKWTGPGRAVFCQYSAMISRILRHFFERTMLNLK